MADQITKTCDFPVTSGRGKAPHPHGVPVPDNRATEFGFGGRTYTADLCDEHRHALEVAIQPWMAISKSVRTVQPTTKRGRLLLSGKKGTFTTKDVREWLAEQGREVPASGRIANSVIEEYKQAKHLV